MTYQDKRDWREYNEHLVKRGWFYLSTDFVKNWDEELKKMNKSKNGHPYRYPETFIQFCGLTYTFLHLPYRQLEGFLQALSGFVPDLKSADYSTLWQRIADLELNIPIPDNEIVVAVDSRQRVSFRQSAHIWRDCKGDFDGCQWQSQIPQ